MGYIIPYRQKEMAPVTAGLGANGASEWKKTVDEIFCRLYKKGGHREHYGWMILAEFLQRNCIDISIKRTHVAGHVSCDVSQMVINFHFLWTSFEGEEGSFKEEQETINDWKQLSKLLRDHDVLPGC